MSKLFRATLKGGHEILLNEQQYAVVDTLLTTKPGSTMVKLGEEQLRLSEIRRIERDELAEQMAAKLERQAALKQRELLPKPPQNTCKGQYSIQKHINKIALKRPNWTSLIKNAEWREQARLELRKRSDKWCDSRDKQCMCEPGFKGTPVVMPVGVFG